MNRINLICLGVSNLQKSFEFYKRLGFETSIEEARVIVFFNNQGSKLELYPIDLLAKDINEMNPPITQRGSFNGITLACNMKSVEEVDDVFAIVESIGGTIVKHPTTTSWGGYSGYFVDPDGYHFEVAYADSWNFDENDMLIIE